MSELVYLRKKAVDEDGDKKGSPAGHAIGVDAETAKALLLDDSLEKCKRGDGWKKSGPTASK